MARRATEATSTKKPAGRAWTRSAVVGALGRGDHQALCSFGGGPRGLGSSSVSVLGVLALGSWSAGLWRVRRRVALEVGAGELEKDVVEGGRAQCQAHHRGARRVQGEGDRAHDGGAVVGVHRDLVV